jgi:transposase-like protein
MEKPTSLHVSKSVSLLGIPGLRVLDVWEFAAERHVFVDTPRYREVCRECGQWAESGGRPWVHIRDLPSAGKATRLVWIKREWRCRDCRRSWRETHPEIARRAALTERARREAARQVGQEGQAVAAVARTFGVGWETVMRAVRGEARPDAAQDRRRLADSRHPKTSGPQRSIRARRPRVHRVGPVMCCRRPKRPRTESRSRVGAVSRGNHGPWAGQDGMASASSARAPCVPSRGSGR